MSQEHQEYIQQKVNPILENLVTQLLLERPDNLSSFMIKWLSEHSKIAPSAVLTEGVNELADLKAELAQLTSEVGQLEEEVGTVLLPTKGGAADEEEEEEEEEDEDGPDIEDLPPPSSYMNKGPRTSVSAEAYGAWNAKSDWKPPVYPKTDSQKHRILDVLKESFLFSSLDQPDIDMVVDAMQEKVVDAGTRVINQGDDGDCLFLVQEGQINCYKKQADTSEEKLVKECKVGDAFGELALLYNCPRAASAVAQGSCTLWQLDRESFNNIIKDAAYKKRERYEAFLKRVPVLQSMEAYELQSMCDALRCEQVKSGDVIVQQGEPGDRFYILEEGECKASKVYVKGTTAREVMIYKSGDYFGELALLKEEPRAATVTATTDCKVLVLSRRTFKSVLGPLQNILTRNATQLYTGK